MAIKIYTKEYAGLLQDIFEVKQHFLNTFGGSLQVTDGISNKDNFLELKVSDTDVVIQEYSLDPNIGFGTGTGSSNRFGERKEIISTDIQVPYEKPLAIHEGVDNYSVNDNADQVIKERTALHSEAWIDYINKFLSEALLKNAGGTLKATAIMDAFNEGYKTFINNKVSQSVGWTAYVTADVYNAIIDHELTTTGKNSGVDIDSNTGEMLKGFKLEVLADEYFGTSKKNIILAADNVGVAGVGIETYRLIDSEDFDGVAIQGAGKYGKYIPEKNKKAILVGTLSTTPVTDTEVGA